VKHLDETQAAYEALRAEFTAVVSHELRTPLARLSALLESALLPTTDAGELVAQAQQEVDHMSELVDDILFLSELETGREVVGLSSTAAAPTVQDVVAELEEAALRAGVTLRVELDENVRLPLRARMLRVVLENLIGNAIRYSGPNTTCTVSLERVGDDAILSVADDGAGVEEEDFDRLFERFYRADRVRASRGTGLGLAIVKHIVGSAGGTVEARRAKKGRGLEIRCTLAAS
jgi:two-component system phosphate regulon sensor histidine kinase PhoR